MNIICNTYEESISQYLKEALVEAMRFDIEEGNFCEALLEMISSNDKTDNNDGGTVSIMMSYLQDRPIEEKDNYRSFSTSFNLLS